MMMSLRNMKTGMKKRMIDFPNNKVKMLQFPKLSEICNISHFVTTRHGGVSKGTYASFNPGEYCGDDNEDVLINRFLLSEAIGIPQEKIIAPYQIHKDEVRVIDSSFYSFSIKERQDYLYGVDALVSFLPNVCVAISTADCVPILLYAPDIHAVAAIHAGWRGSVLQIAKKVVRLLIDDYAADPSLMRVGIGPSISLEAFEVGEEVVDAFCKNGFDMDRIMRRDSISKKAHIDLWEANRMQLMDCGLLSKNIEVAGICTYTDYTNFFSARRLGIKSGRILSGITLI